MTKQQKAAALAFLIGILFIALQLGLDVETGFAGLFVTGMAGGLLVGDAMSRTPKACPK